MPLREGDTFYMNTELIILFEAFTLLVQYLFLLSPRIAMQLTLLIFMGVLEKKCIAQYTPGAPE